MSERTFRLLVVGVGGQGVLSAARVLGEAAWQSGGKVRIGQLHGMSQRGGSVEGLVVIGPGHTAFIGPRQADVVLGLEPLEALRATPRMSERTEVIASRTPVPIPSAAQRGVAAPDPDTIAARIRAVTERVHWLDAAELAEAAGDPRCLNVVMLGFLAGLDLLPFDAEFLAAAVDRHGPGRQSTIHRRALELGQEAVTRR